MMEIALRILSLNSCLYSNSTRRTFFDLKSRFLDLRMSSLIQTIAKLSQQTFKNQGDNSYLDYLHSLRKLCSQLSMEDVSLSREVIEKNRSSFSSAAHVGIYENNTFSMGIFILPRSGIIPLHDHPGMSGIVKVLYGRINVKSYSVLRLDQPQVIPDEVLSKVPSTNEGSLIPCLYCGERESTTSEDTFLLTPDESNIHEVTSVNGPSAFLDILGPPYISGERDCNYYTVLGSTYESNLKRNISWLLRLTYPPPFWCDSVPYTGPRIK